MDTRNGTDKTLLHLAVERVHKASAKLGGLAAAA